MSDLKRACPACDSWTTAVGVAFRDGEPCPYCGLPADVTALLDKAAAKGVRKAVMDRLAAAELRAVKAERRAAELSAVLADVRRIAEMLDAD